MFQHVSRSHLIRYVKNFPTFNLHNWNHCIASCAVRIAGMNPHAMEAEEIRLQAANLLGIPFDTELFNPDAKVDGEIGSAFNGWYAANDKDFARRLIESHVQPDLITPEHLISAIYNWPQQFNMASWEWCIAGYAVKLAGFSFDPECYFVDMYGTRQTRSIPDVAADLLGVYYDCPLFTTGKWPVDLQSRTTLMGSCPDLAIEAIKRYFCM